VFMNLYLFTHVRAALEQACLQVLVGKELPANDGCISYGEAVVALARLQDAN
jgi:hydrogenase maturation protein HypF